MDELEPKILFDGQWIPAHQAWRKLEVATQAAETLERFNREFPHLATSETQAVVEEVKRRMRNIELLMPKRPSHPQEMHHRAQELLQQLGLEETLDILNAEFASDLDLRTLLTLIGQRTYLTALQSEVADLRQNKISDEQTAALWNDSHRPAPGGGLWTATKVRAVAAGDAD